MERSIGRDPEPTTEHSDARVAGDGDSPDDVAPAPQSPELDADVRHRLRDLPPSPMGTHTGIVDLDELQREVDPLDPRQPGRTTSDPLDPEGRAI